MSNLVHQLKEPRYSKKEERERREAAAEHAAAARERTRNTLAVAPYKSPWIIRAK